MGLVLNFQGGHVRRMYRRVGGGSRGGRVRAMRGAGASRPTHGCTLSLSPVNANLKGPPRRGGSGVGARAFGPAPPPIWHWHWCRGGAWQRMGGSRVWAKRPSGLCTYTGVARAGGVPRWLIRIAVVGGGCWWVAYLVHVHPRPRAQMGDEARDESRAQVHFAWSEPQLCVHLLRGSASALASARACM